MNSQLEIKHVLGSTYHPQSQGLVERMHRTMKAVITALCHDHPQKWVAMMPYAQSVLLSLIHI